MAAQVTTRRAWKIQLQEEVESRAVSSQPPDTSYPPTSSPGSLSPPSSPLTDTSDLDIPSPSRDTSVSASSSSKRQRAPSLLSPPKRVARPQKIKKRTSLSTCTSESSSREESRQGSVPLEEPIYRSDRSRSTSVFPPPDPDNVPATEWWSTEDGSPGEGFVSAADVVCRLAKSYKSCEYFTTYVWDSSSYSSCMQDFRNPDDPDDKFFEVESSPTADLEYPNNYANEKCVAITIFLTQSQFSCFPHLVDLCYWYPRIRTIITLLCVWNSRYTLLSIVCIFSILPGPG